MKIFLTLLHVSIFSVAKASVGKTLNYNKGGLLGWRGCRREGWDGIPVAFAFLMRFRDHCITHAGMNSYGDQLDSATKKWKE